MRARAASSNWTTARGSRIKSPPVDGKANAELVALAQHFGVRKAQVSIKAARRGA